MSAIKVVPISIIKVIKVFKNDRDIFLIIDITPLRSIRSIITLKESTTIKTDI